MEGVKSIQFPDLRSVFFPCFLGLGVRNGLGSWFQVLEQDEEDPHQAGEPWL